MKIRNSNGQYVAKHNGQFYKLRYSKRGTPIVSKASKELREMGSATEYCRPYKVMMRAGLFSIKAKQ